MGPHEPYWRTNTSFSPPPSRWDFRFQSESLPYPYGLRDDRLYYDSSTSSNSKESRSWVRVSRRYSQSDGPGPYFSSPSEISQAQQWTPPTIQGMNVADYETTARRGKFFNCVCKGVNGVDFALIYPQKRLTSIYGYYLRWIFFEFVKLSDSMRHCIF